MNTLSRLCLYWHTIRYLRPVQIYGRVWFRLKRPRPDMSPAPQVQRVSGEWKACQREPSLVGPSKFRFLSTERQIVSATDWNRKDWPKLWLYNAHYFDDWVAENAQERTEWHRALMQRWIEENPPGCGNGWEPYPSSLRIVNWIKWALLGNEPGSGCLDSLASQVRYLEQRLEWHLLGNHLWANAKALIFAGCYFSGDEGARWLKLGLKIFEEQRQEQILADGGHFERSPMYQGILTEDILDLIQLSQLYPNLNQLVSPGEWGETAAKMLRWLQIMTHPDGEIAFFNDAAWGIAPKVDQLIAYAKCLDVAVEEAPLGALEHLKDSGYVRLQKGEAVLWADVGDIGPDYLPGHAHADTLSFELSLRGRRILVNGGTSTYDKGEERQAQRSSSFHNTVEVDDQSSSEVWGSFRVARRAYTSAVMVQESNDYLSLSAEHDGYLRLPGRVLHRRHWVLGRNSLTIEDQLVGRFQSAKAYYRLAPEGEPRGEGVVYPESEGREIFLRYSSEGGSPSLEEGKFAPQFGFTQRCRMWVFSFLSPRMKVQFLWD